MKIQFKKFTSFEVVFKVRDSLLAFDNLREQIFNDKKLSKLETAGRHENLSVIDVNHILVQKNN